jgi:hypothetical protein
VAQPTLSQQVIALEEAIGVRIFVRGREGSHNTFVQGLFDALTARVGKAYYITSEFGAGLALIMTATAFVLLCRGSLGRTVDKLFSIDSGRTE